MLRFIERYEIGMVERHEIGLVLNIFDKVHFAFMNFFFVAGESLVSK